MRTDVEGQIGTHRWTSRQSKWTERSMLASLVAFSEANECVVVDVLFGGVRAQRCQSCMLSSAYSAAEAATAAPADRKRRPLS